MASHGSAPSWGAPGPAPAKWGDFSAVRGASVASIRAKPPRCVEDQLEASVRNHGINFAISFFGFHGLPLEGGRAASEATDGRRTGPSGGRSG